VTTLLRLAFWRSITRQKARPASAGRATIALLRMNRPVLMQMRRYWVALGLHPPR